MAEFGAGELNRGLISLEHDLAEVVVVYFHATAESLKSLHLPEGEKLEPIRILEVDENEGRVRMYPIGTQPVAHLFGKPKYSKLRMISVPLDYLTLPASANDVPDLLEDLPRGFLKDYQFGLGLAKPYQSIVTAIERHAKCSRLHLTKEGKAKVEKDTLYVSLDDFEQIRSESDRIASRANAAASNVKAASAVNWLANHLGTQGMPYKRGRHPMIQRFADASAGHGGLDDKDAADLLALLDQNVSSVSHRRPEAVAKLRRDIELVQLDGLIEKFQKMLAAAHLEDVWQTFFTENPFILTFAFGYPMILVQDQAVAGGRKISGSGEKVADFISKNPTTNNVAIIEIKKPGTSLLQRTEYRRGVYGPSTELTGSVTQILDQRYHLVSEFATMQRASRIYDIESFAVQLCLIAGRTPTNPDEAKSFELFRDSLASVQIITFDELLKRVQLLRSFLAD